MLRYRLQNQFQSFANVKGKHNSPGHAFRFFLGQGFIIAAIFLNALAPQITLAQQGTTDSVLVYLPLVLKAGAGTPPLAADGPTIGPVNANLGDYPGSAIPKYNKLELTFNVDTVAQNLQLPYDASPPPGVTPKIGVTVNALFTPDNWQTVFIQPAFYYQDFDYQIKSGADWISPTSNFSWKVRFAPNQTGAWQYKLTAQDATGTTETTPQSFTVVDSGNKGFIRVSPNDPRYFEYDDGSYFPALGYNLNYRRVDWVNPVQGNEATFQTMSENHIQLVRIWLSQWSIYGSAWNPWRSHNPAHNTQDPDIRLRHDAVFDGSGPTEPQPPIAVPTSETFLWLSYDETVFSDGKQWNFTPCMLLGEETPRIPVERNITYHLRVRYREQGLAGPKVTGKPYGFTVKLGGWLWDETDESKRCYAPDTGTLLAATYSTAANWQHYADPDNAGWQILEGTFNSGNTDFLDKFYLALENVTAGNVFVDYVWVEKDLGNGQYGPNLIYKPWMAPHLYFDQRESYAFDQVLELARQYNIYFKPVILEKHDYALNIFERDGSMSPKLPHQNGWQLFYGAGREEIGKTKVRWLQEAWWRYLQARWGFSPNIHSWELLNEGDPGAPLHRMLVDEMGKYFQTAFIPAGQTTLHPDRHLVTTSFWSSFPNSFWGSSDYPYVDYADVHHYANEGSTEPLGYIYDPSDFYDAALFSQKLSMVHGAKQPDGPGKPVMRGETGWAFNGSDVFAQNQTNGLWLHNFIWAGINSGGLIESYWVGSPTQDHIYNSTHDHRPMFKTYYNFIYNIPLSNGYYQEAGAVPSTPNLRAWGQKDLVNGQAHLWLQNSNHTWKNVLDGKAISGVTGTVTLDGFQPGKQYTLEWWDTTKPDPAQQIVQTETITGQPDGSLVIGVNNLTTDIAVKIR